jgi:hypothetical protein
MDAPVRLGLRRAAAACGPPVAQPGILWVGGARGPLALFCGGSGGERGLGGVVAVLRNGEGCAHLLHLFQQELRSCMDGVGALRRAPGGHLGLSDGDATVESGELEFGELLLQSRMSVLELQAGLLGRGLGGARRVKISLEVYL